MKKFLLLFTLVVAMAVQSSAQVVLPAEKYVWEYAGVAADSVGPVNVVWQKAVQLNKIDGVFYNAKVKISDITAGATGRVVMQSKIFATDTYTPIDSVTWYGGGTDTTVVFTHNTNKTYHRYLNFVVRRTANRAKLTKIDLSIKK